MKIGGGVVFSPMHAELICFGLPRSKDWWQMKFSNDGLLSCHEAGILLDDSISECERYCRKHLTLSLWAFILLFTNNW